MKGVDETKTRHERQNAAKMKFSEIEEMLRNMDFDVQTMLSSFVASICDVDEADMLTNTEKLYISQARWLFWHVLRYTCGETYERIAQRTSLSGREFTSAGVRKGCEKIADLIEKNKMWQTRYAVARKFLNLINNPHDYFISDFANPLPQRYKLRLSVPKELKKSITIEVEEK